MSEKGIIKEDNKKTRKYTLKTAITEKKYSDIVILLNFDKNMKPIYL